MSISCQSESNYMYIGYKPYNALKEFGCDCQNIARAYKYNIILFISIERVFVISF